MRCLGLGKRALVNRTRVLAKETPESLLISSAISGSSKKNVVCEEVGPHQTLNVPASLSWTSELQKL